MGEMEKASSAQNWPISDKSPSEKLPLDEPNPLYAKSLENDEYKKSVLQAAALDTHAPKQPQSQYDTTDQEHQQSHKMQTYGVSPQNLAPRSCPGG